MGWVVLNQLIIHKKIFSKMDFKKLILATMGVAMSVCAANAQSWKYNGSYGIYSYPTTSVTGNLTLGTTPSSTTSQYKLYVNGETMMNGNFTTTGSFAARGSSNYVENGLSIYATNQMSRTGLWISSNPDGGGMRIASSGYHNYGDLAFVASTYYFAGTYGVNYMDLSDSKTKILTDLEVSGKIKCQNELEVAEVKADQINTKDINVEMNNAADYVFDENYNLRSLSDVESFVKENKHLPGVPSAAEMAEKGMSLSQMSNLLLEKVEELTLHMIELEKENKELKNRVEMLEK